MPLDDDDDPELNLVPFDGDAAALPFDLPDADPNDTPESCSSPTGITPVGSGGTPSSDPESPLNAFFDAG